MNSANKKNADSLSAAGVFSDQDKMIADKNPLSYKTSDLHATHDVLVKLERSKHASETLIYKLPEIIVTIDEQGRILKGNRAAEQALSEQEGGLIYGRFSRLFSDRSWELFWTKIQAVLKSENPQLVESMDLSTDGTNMRNRFFRWNLFKVKDLSASRGALIHVVGHDITEVKMMLIKIKESHENLKKYQYELEKHLNIVQKQKAQLLESSKIAQLGEMASGIAEEINYPVSSMKGFAEDLGKILTNDELEKENIRRSALEITSIVGQIATIVKSMRTLSRDGSKDLFEPSDLVSIVNDSLIFFRERLRKNLIKLTVRCPYQSITMNCRAVSICQMLINILNNSSDAVSKSENEKWIDIEIIDQKETVTIKVTDSGEPIDDEIKQKMMLPFFSTKPSGEGTGLGLSVASTIAKDHGGTLELNCDHPQTQIVIRLSKLLDFEYS